MRCSSEWKPSDCKAKPTRFLLQAAPVGASNKKQPEPKKLVEEPPKKKPPPPKENPRVVALQKAAKVCPPLFSAYAVIGLLQCKTSSRILSLKLYNDVVVEGALNLSGVGNSI